MNDNLQNEQHAGLENYYGETSKCVWRNRSPHQGLRLFLQSFRRMWSTHKEKQIKLWKHNFLFPVRGAMTKWILAWRCLQARTLIKCFIRGILDDVNLSYSLILFHGIIFFPCRPTIPCSSSSTFKVTKHHSCTRAHPEKYRNRMAILFLSHLSSQESCIRTKILNILFTLTLYMWHFKLPICGMHKENKEFFFFINIYTKRFFFVFFKSPMTYSFSRLVVTALQNWMEQKRKSLDAGAAKGFKIPDFGFGAIAISLQYDG